MFLDSCFLSRPELHSIEVNRHSDRQQKTAMTSHDCPRAHKTRKKKEGKSVLSFSILVIQAKDYNFLFTYSNQFVNGNEKENFEFEHTSL